MSASLPSWARVGVRVVCIKRDQWKLEAGRDLRLPKPKYGDVCIISDTDLWQGIPVLKLAGCGDHWFFARRFRPAVEPKSEAHDVALFRKLLRQPELVE